MTLTFRSNNGLYKVRLTGFIALDTYKMLMENIQYKKSNRHLNGQLENVYECIDENILAFQNVGVEIKMFKGDYIIIGL
jgi:hypothetical protein